MELSDDNTCLVFKQSTELKINSSTKTLWLTAALKSAEKKKNS